MQKYLPKYTCQSFEGFEGPGQIFEGVFRDNIAALGRLKTKRVMERKSIDGILELFHRIKQKTCVLGVFLNKTDIILKTSSIHTKRFCTDFMLKTFKKLKLVRLSFQIS